MLQCVFGMLGMCCSVFLAHHVCAALCFWHTRHGLCRNVLQCVFGILRMCCDVFLAF